jgi:hypothetical protein
MSERAEYTVLLEVRVQGPDTDWNRVAYGLAGRVANLRFDGFTVTEVGVDEAKESE